MIHYPRRLATASSLAFLSTALRGANELLRTSTEFLQDQFVDLSSAREAHLDALTTCVCATRGAMRRQIPDSHGQRDRPPASLALRMSKNIEGISVAAAVGSESMLSDVAKDKKLDRLGQTRDARERKVES
jgi:hypothetical protein